MFENVRIVLVNTSHPGNIGAAARAMKNMGLFSLYLVDPPRFPHKEATVRAAGADDILANARVVDHLMGAVGDCRLVFGTSARTRSLPWPTCTPKECAEKVHGTSQETDIALVFGRESSGLTNEELALCHFHVHIPTNPDFSSLNLASAVQVIAYELLSTVKSEISENLSEDGLASVQEVQGFLAHFESLLKEIKFLDPNHPKLLLQRLQRLFNRAQLEQKEIHILRGILSTIEKRLLVL